MLARRRGRAVDGKTKEKIKVRDVDSRANGLDVEGREGGREACGVARVAVRAGWG